MKEKLIFATTLMTVLMGVIAPNASAGVCSVGQRADVLWKGAWYPAKVLQVNGDNCYITYEGYDSSWDEWVEAGRFRASFAVGDSVKVLWKGQWYPGHILDTDGNSYKITYDGYDSSWDEWVEPARVSR
jgi:hypothetical protein